MPSDLIGQLTELAGLMNRAGQRNVYQFLLDLGEEYEGAPLPAGEPQGEVRQCFSNALTLAVLRGWVYVEGYAMSPVGLAVHHAWCVTDEESRTVIDPTWDHPEKCSYYGIQFQTEWVMDLSYTGEALEEYARAWYREQDEESRRQRS